MNPLSHNPHDDITAVIDLTLDLADYHACDADLEVLEGRCANAYKLLKHVQRIADDHWKSSDYTSTPIDVHLKRIRDEAEHAAEALGNFVQRLHEAQQIENIENVQAIND